MFTQLLWFSYASSTHTQDVREARPVRTILGACAMAIGSVALIVWAPAIVGFGVAILAAVCWCIWLERHPST